MSKSLLEDTIVCQISLVDGKQIDIEGGMEKRGGHARSKKLRSEHGESMSFTIGKRQGGNCEALVEYVGR